MDLIIKKNRDKERLRGGKTGRGKFLKQKTGGRI